jgi:hypothetical protein
MMEGREHAPTTRQSHKPIRSVLVLGGLFFLWLAGLAAIGFLRLYYEHADPLSILWGVACYSAGFLIVKPLGPRRRVMWKTVLLYISAAALILITPSYVVPYFRNLAWDPIGLPSDLGLGAPACHVYQDRVIPSGSGRVVVVRRNWCDFGFGESAASYFLFVRDANEASNQRNLVFRYDSTMAGWGNDPKVRWRSPSVVDVSIATGAIKRITKKKAAQDGVSIFYHTSKERG